MHALPFIAGSVYFITTAATTGAQTCYFPNGVEATNDTPCRATQPGQASACCAHLDICLDNKLCLPQGGNKEIVWRGSCTDHSWQSGDCPQYCQDGKFFPMIPGKRKYSCVLATCYFVLVRCPVLHKIDPRSHFLLSVSTNHGVPIFPFQLDTDYCCGPGNSSSGKCKHSTRGSVEPFPINVGRVIFNRTSGSTSPNDSDTSSITILSTATVTVSSGTALSTAETDPSDNTIQQTHDTSSSSKKSTAIGVGVGVPCGLALLGAMGLLWRQRARELDARREARDWEEKYTALLKSKQGGLIGTGNYMQELVHEEWRPDEIDGRLVYEAPDRTWTRGSLIYQTLVRLDPGHREVYMLWVRTVHPHEKQQKFDKIRPYKKEDSFLRTKDVRVSHLVPKHSGSLIPRLLVITFKILCIVIFLLVSLFNFQIFQPKNYKKGWI